MLTFMRLTSVTGSGLRRETAEAQPAYLTRVVVEGVFGGGAAACACGLAR